MIIPLILTIACVALWTFSLCKAASRNQISIGPKTMDPPRVSIRDSEAIKGPITLASTVVHPCSDRDLGGLQSAGEYFPYVCHKCRTAFRDPEALGDPFCCPHCGGILTTDREASLKSV